MRKFRQALRFLQDFAREFCSGRKQGMKKDRRKGGLSGLFRTGKAPYSGGIPVRFPGPIP